MHENPNKKQLEIKPFHFFIIIIASIFSGELILMIFFQFLPKLNAWLLAFLDSFLLILLLLPMVHLFIILPLKQQIDERQKTELALEETRENFINILMHDLKDPTISMLAAAQTINDHMNELSEENKKNLLQDISYCGSAALNLINNLTNASRIESGKMPYTFERINAAELLNELKTVFASPAQIKKIRLDFSCAENIFIKADYEKIKQVFYNLISNAIRHTPEGGAIKISCEQNNGKIDFEVSDTGSGISKQEQENLFKKFAQAKGRRGGTGLGLYIAKTFLEGHGENIRLESEDNKGAKFYFSLPMS